MKRFLRIVIIVSVFDILAFLPVVPISIAPVVLNPTYSFRMVSSLDIFSYALMPPDGVHYQWYWYTFVVLLVLIVTGCLVSVLLLRKIGDSPKN